MRGYFIFRVKRCVRERCHLPRIATGTRQTICGTAVVDDCHEIRGLTSCFANPVKSICPTLHDVRRAACSSAIHIGMKHFARSV